MLILRRHTTAATLKTLRNVHISAEVTSTAPTQPHQSATTTTVDTEDVKRHGKLAQDWWNRTGPMRALHSMNQIR